jgi:predicted RecB family nuclease
MIVSAPLFRDYLECLTKCWLRSRAEPSTGNAYAEWVRLQNETYYEDGLKRLLPMFPESNHAIAPPISKCAKDATWRLAIDMRLRRNGLESRLQAVERIPPEGRRKSLQLIPYRFQFANKLAKIDKLSLAFDALLLSETVGQEVSLGKIMHGDGYSTLKVNLSSLASEVRKRITEVSALLADNSPPALVLNRHCGQCEFQARCRKQATERDELSLLSGMSEKEREKLHGKGIFTVTQLSYTFRPRRRRRELRGKQEKFHHSLRALAIRENKVHVVDLPDPKLNGTPVYLDVEGLPDRDSYYLIGTRVGTGDDAVQYGFWADDEDGEKRIWDEFLDVLSVIPDPQLVHFGSYETTFLKRMRERHGGPREGSAAATALKGAVNLLSFVFARIYFPTFSNGLKEIARYLGFRWSCSPASGLEAIVWRHRWEVSKDPSLKQALLEYNREDCESLEIVANSLVDLHREAPANGQSARSDVVRTTDMKPENPFRFGRIEFALTEMDAINKAAYWDYQRERVYVKSANKLLVHPPPTSSPHHKPKPNATIDCPPPSCCPTCKSKRLYGHDWKNKTIIDLRFMKHGIKRWVTRYIIHRYRCQSCGSTFNPSARRWTPAKYGPDLIAYTMYQNIELGLPQLRIDSSLSKLFGLHLPRGWSNKIKAATAASYRSTYNNLLKKLCSGSLLHVDETTVSVKGVSCYVWVLASLDEVAYYYSSTREADTIQRLLKDFTGVLVSDFYAAYDAINCPQQKCLIHFIRDLNGATLKHPYDVGLKRLAGDFATLLKPMVETVDRHGLKKRFLARHRSSVHRFYKRLSDCAVTNEAAEKLVSRLQKNRNKMFTFLNFDNVPWNNNNAEHAVKAFGLASPRDRGADYGKRSSRLSCPAEPLRDLQIQKRRLPRFSALWFKGHRRVRDQPYQATHAESESENGSPERGRLSSCQP